VVPSSSSGGLSSSSSSAASASSSPLAAPTSVPPQPSAAPELSPGEAAFYEALDSELSRLCRLVALTPAEQEARSIMAARINSTLSQALPSATMRLYGSWASGLSLPSSDIDIAVSSSEDPADSFEKASSALHACAGPLEWIAELPKAAVPLLKVRDPATGVVADVAFNVQTAVESVRFTQESLVAQAGLHASTLVLTLKLLVHIAGLNEVFRGGVSSYGIHLLVSAYLRYVQTHGGVWMSPGGLFLGFLDHYRRGGAFDPARHTVDCTLPSGLEEGVMEGTRKPKPGGAPVWCVRDPNAPASNVTGGSFRMDEVTGLFDALSVQLRAMAGAGAPADPSGSGFPILCAAADACGGKITSGMLRQRIVDRILKLQASRPRTTRVSVVQPASMMRLRTLLAGSAHGLDQQQQRVLVIKSGPGGWSSTNYGSYGGATLPLRA